MTDKEELESNIACAKLLGYEVVEVATIERGECMVEMDILKIREFNIFTNASQCLEVVKKLGYDYDISFSPSGFSRWCYEKTGVLTRIDCEFNTYEEAVASAVLEVTK